MSYGQLRKSKHLILGVLCMQTLILPGVHAQSPPLPTGTNGGNKTPLKIISINGPAEVGPGTYSYTAPADGGSPHYTYTWTPGPSTATGDTVSATWIRTGGATDTSVQEETLTASIVDQAGETASKSLTVKLHPAVEVEVKGASSASTPTDEEILVTVTLADDLLTASYTVTASRAFTVGIEGSVEGTVLKVITATASVNASYQYTTSNSTTLNFSRPNGVTGNYTVQGISYPTFTRKNGTWKKWGNGVTASGDWKGTCEPSRHFFSRHVEN